MNDDFLSGLQEDPRPEFTDRLWRRLETLEAEEPARPRPRRLPLRPWPLLAGATLVGLIVAVVGLAPVRAAARGFLDFFRIKKFAAIPVDPERLNRLRDGKLDLKTLVGEQVEVLQPPAEPVVVESTEAAARLAGLTLRRPTTPPRGATLFEVRVGSPGAFRVTLDTGKIEQLARTLGAKGVEVPNEWDGATIEVEASPVVAMVYRRGGDDFVFLQARSPAVRIPEGVDLVRLGEIGLQMAGMSLEEARIFARTIDWRSTLLVPVPLDGGSFREVEVGGARGLLVTSYNRPKPGSSTAGGWRSVVLWSEGDQVFGIEGRGNGVEILAMAQSVG
jgi:hypothetical protein